MLPVLLALSLVACDDHSSSTAPTATPVAPVPMTEKEKENFNVYYFTCVCSRYYDTRPWDTTGQHEFKCKYCNKTVASNQRLKRHLDICNEKTRKIIEEKDKIIEEQKNNFVSKCTELDELKKIISELTTEVRNRDREITRLSAIIEKAVSKPTNVTNNNTDNRSVNVVNFLRETNKPIKVQTLMDNVQYLTKEYCIDGGVGLARYYMEHPFKEAPLICTDSVRKNFSYLVKTREATEIIKDKKLCKLNPNFFEIITKEVEHQITKHIKLQGYNPDKPDDQIMIAKYLGIVNDVKSSAKGVETKTSVDLINSLASRTSIDLVRSMFRGCDFDDSDSDDDTEKTMLNQSKGKDV